jgi:ABC-type oligopeptide transport system substrate-binding subunit
MNLFTSMRAKLAVLCLAAALALSLAACGEQKAEQKAAEKPAVEAKPAE